ncbi:hypothetical protein MRS44_000478 [Fusarium solani]|uniref:uncharacterized protein n=1 Tax=Fusarium solani TaxID=169388 RepID=UPI0032C3E60F|nr:hypothetical protein MRS44_000478 [Fusarium solani]
MPGQHRAASSQPAQLSTDSSLAPSTRCLLPSPPVRRSSAASASAVVCRAHTNPPPPPPPLPAPVTTTTFSLQPRTPADLSTSSSVVLPRPNPDQPPRHLTKYLLDDGIPTAAISSWTPLRRRQKDDIENDTTAHPSSAHRKTWRVPPQLASIHLPSHRPRQELPSYPNYRLRFIFTSSLARHSHSSLGSYLALPRSSSATPPNPRPRCSPKWLIAKRTRPRGSSRSALVTRAMLKTSPKVCHLLAPHNPALDLDVLTAVPPAPADIISTVEFDHTGNYLATGDKGGRVVLFERNETKKTCEYKFHTEFQSHEPEFDYLKSLEIEEKINKIKWCRRQNASHYLLSTNDKTIKLWKVFEKSLKVVAENNLSHDVTPGSLAGGGGAPRPLPAHRFRDAADLKLPRLTHHDTVVAAVPRRTYANAHAYHINSISVNSDGETFISSDDLRINLWNLNIQEQSFNIVDIKPANMEELTEVITAAEFHPMSCNWFMYASSKGTIKLADMRQSALCDQHAKLFEQEEDPSSRSFFSEIISSISDVRFSYDGRYILSRDYLTVKIWDINMERQPVKTIPIHEHLRPRLCDTYENDSIFDKFEVVFSGDAKNVMTGSYNNNFMIYPSDPDKEVEVVLQADKSAFKAKKVGVPTPINSSTSPTATNGKKGGSRAGSPGGQGQRMRKETDADQIDFNKKILHMSWHPFEDSIAIAATNNLFVFSAL